jgi:hypothetical protein
MNNDEQDEPRGLPPEVVQDIYGEVIGYGRPPRHSRFPKGKSGNPDGRPVKEKPPARAGRAGRISPSVAAQASEIVRKPIKAREGGQERDVDTVEVALRKLQRKALDGHVAAIRLLFEYLGEHERLQALERALSAVEREKERALYRKHIADARQEIAKADRLGLPEPELYPHPDDVLFEPDGRVRVVGPMNAKEAESYAHMARSQEFWIAHMAYDRWLRDRRRAQNPHCPSLGWQLLSDLCFWWCHASLPERMQMSEAHVAAGVLTALQRSGAAQYASLKRLGHALGWPVPPRHLTIPVGVSPGLIGALLH